MTSERALPGPDGGSSSKSLANLCCGGRIESGVVGGNIGAGVEVYSFLPERLWRRFIRNRSTPALAAVSSTKRVFPIGVSLARQVRLCFGRMTAVSPQVSPGPNHFRGLEYLWAWRSSGPGDFDSPKGCARPGPWKARPPPPPPPPRWIVQLHVSRHVLTIMRRTDPSLEVMVKREEEVRSR